MDIELVRRRLSDHRPDRLELETPHRASVAVVLREGDRSAEVLLIERAIHEHDPWSGHMAFPGGRVDPGDATTRATAARETLEEVGVDLAAAEYLGHVDELAGNRQRTPPLVVSAHAFHVAAPGPFRIDETEVQQAFWFPLADLHDHARHVEHVIPELPQVQFPGIVVGEPDRHVVWGLTFRFLDRMLRVLGHPFERPWGNLSHFVDEKDRPLRR